jgi:hypothetical protein
VATDSRQLRDGGDRVPTELQRALGHRTPPTQKPSGGSTSPARRASQRPRRNSPSRHVEFANAVFTFFPLRRGAASFYSTRSPGRHKKEAALGRCGSRQFHAFVVAVAARDLTGAPRGPRSPVATCATEPVRRRQDDRGRAPPDTRSELHACARHMMGSRTADRLQSFVCLAALKRHACRRAECRSRLQRASARRRRRAGCLACNVRRP